MNQYTLNQPSIFPNGTVTGTILPQFYPLPPPVHAMPPAVAAYFSFTEQAALEVFRRLVWLMDQKLLLDANEEKLAARCWKLAQALAEGKPK